jgi:hypothetical protein
MMWSLTGDMYSPREGHTATLLPSGEVLIVGGMNRHSIVRHGVVIWFLDELSSAELYHPDIGKFAVTGSCVHKRFLHTATLLLDGTVLVVGGLDNITDTELYQPSTGTWVLTRGGLNTPRVQHGITIQLQDGEVLVAGGLGGVDKFDPVTRSCDV